MKKPTPLKQILSSKNPELQRLLDHTWQIDLINQQLRQLLPPPLPLHCNAAGVTQQTLTILVDSPAWGTRLRLHAPNLIRALADFQIKSIAVKIAPPSTPTRLIAKNRAAMSAATSQLLSHVADATSDTKLKMALQRLARNASKQREE